MTLLALLFASTAPAAPRCTGTLSPSDLDHQLDAFDAAVAEFDLNAATEQLKATHAGLLCMDTIVPPQSLGRLARQLALTFFFDQDEDATRRWGLLQRYAAPDLPWSDETGEDHPFREALETAEDPIQGGPTDQSLVVPKNGGIFLNGQFLAEPRYHAEVPGFMQVADKKGVIIDQFWQDGAAFPDRLLGPRSASPRPPKWWNGPTKAVEAVAIADAAEPEIEPEIDPEIEPEIEPAPEPSTPRALPVVLAAVPADYVDPFEDARLRAIKRERTVREESDRTIVSEVTTFAVVTGGESAVLQRDFAEFIAYKPAWKADAARAAGTADKGYLKGWKGDTPPRPDEPVIGVPFGAAKAYCDDWSQGLALHAFEAAQTVAEWRLADDGRPVRRLANGTVEPWSRPESESESSTGFRCVD